MTGEQAHRTRVTAWLAARPVRHLVLGAGAVVLLVSGAFGGLREAAPDSPPRLRLDEPHVAAPLTVTIRRVVWSDDLGETIGPSDVGRYLVVFADVSTDEKRSVDPFVVRETLRLGGLDGFARTQLDPSPVRSEQSDPLVLVTEDRVKLDELGPGLTYEVAYVWEQKADEPLPDEVTVKARAHTFRQSYVDDQSNWFSVADDAAGRFPVTELDAS